MSGTGTVVPELLVPGMPPVAVVAGLVALCAGAAAWLAVGGRDDTGRRMRVLFADGAGETPGSARPPGHGAGLGGDAATGAGQRALLSVRVGCRPGAHWPPQWARWLPRRTAGSPSGRRWAVGRRMTVGAEVWCLPAGVLIALLGGSALPVGASVVAMAVVRRRLSSREAERVRERRAAEVIELCATVAAELRAGRQPSQALLAAGAPGLGAEGSAVLAAARYGGDVPGALRAAARSPGAEGLAGVAACWQVAVEGGAGLASGLERIADGLRASRDQREELRAQLAGPRATALMLVLLPVCGLLMGSALGADPLRVLLHTPVGWACLVAGGLLEWAGVAWTARIIAGALPPGPRASSRRVAERQRGATDKGRVRG